jgi:hypothetical protein
LAGEYILVVTTHDCSEVVDTGSEISETQGNQMSMRGSWCVSETVRIDT